MLVTIRTSRVKTLLSVCTHTQSAPVEWARRYQTDCIREHLPEKTGPIFELPVHVHPCYP